MRMLTKLFALLVALTFCATDIKPAEAAATIKPVVIDSEYSDLVNVRSRRRNARRGGGRRYSRSRSARRYRGGGRRYGRRYRRSRGRDIGIGIGIGVGSAIIGGAISNSYNRNRYYDNGAVYYSAPTRRVYRTRTRRVRRSNSDSHVGWCARRYRSYNVRSDTFQPYSGGRRRCNSPYN